MQPREQRNGGSLLLDRKVPSCRVLILSNNVVRRSTSSILAICFSCTQHGVTTRVEEKLKPVDGSCGGSGGTAAVLCTLQWSRPATIEFVYKYAGGSWLALLSQPKKKSHHFFVALALVMPHQPVWSGLLHL